jgi:hypothetical protein
MAQLLDCHDYETTLRCLANIFGCAENILCDVLSRITQNDLARWWEANSLLTEQLLLQHVVSVTKSYGSFDEMTCFHGCRCLPGEEFSEGLLPTHLVIDRVWKQLRSIFLEFDEEIWRELRHDMDVGPLGDRLGGYRHRLKFSGPYAKQVRPTWFMDKQRDTHYVREGPELAMIICKELSRRANIDAVQGYTTATIPCLVKFRTTRVERHSLAYALLFLYSELHPEQPDLQGYFMGGFNGEGQPVPASDVLLVEYLCDAQITFSDLG